MSDEPLTGARIGANWTPSQNQLKALDYAREREYIANVTKMAEYVGISRQAIYQWNECESFVIWWARKRNEFFGSRLDHIHGMMYARATGRTKKGSFPDAKLFLERFDRQYTPRMRQEVTGADGAPVKTYVNVDVDRVTGKDSDGPEGAEEAEDGG